MSLLGRKHKRDISGLSLRPAKSVKLCPPTEEESNHSPIQDVSMEYEPNIQDGQQDHAVNKDLQLSFLSQPLMPKCIDISELVAWPTSLGAIREQFRYNISPQDGPRLPNHIINAVCARRLGTDQDTVSSSVASRMTYLHLGFACWFNLDVYVFLPNLTSSYLDQASGRVVDYMLEKWTDHVFLPAVRAASWRFAQDPQAPSSWRLSKSNGMSPLWYDSSVAEFPTYKFHDGREFATIWEAVLQYSTKFQEFQNPFLIMHCNRRQPEMFAASNIDEVLRKFEQAWHTHIDTTQIGLGQNDLHISFSCDFTV